MKKLLLVMLIAGSLLFAAGPQLVKAQDTFIPWTEFVDIIAKYSDIEVSYRSVNAKEMKKLSRGERTIPGCVGEVKYSKSTYGFLEEYLWPYNSGQVIGFLDYQTTEFNPEAINMYVVYDSYCNGKGGKGVAMVPQTTPLFSWLNLLYTILVLLGLIVALEILSGGRIRIPI